MRSQLGRRLYALATVALLTTGFLAAWWASSDLRRGWFAANVVASLEATGPQHYALHLAELDALGRPGQEALIDLLGNPNRTLAQAAQAKLLANVDHWRGLPVGRSTPKVELLADCLAERARELGPDGVPPAKRIALELLAWPTRGASSTLVVDCERVLRLPDNDSRDAPGSAATTVFVSVAQKDAASSHPPSHPAPVAVELPGGGLPIDVATVDPSPLKLPEAPPRPLKVVDPEPLTEAPPQHLRPPYALPLPAPLEDPPPTPPEQFRPDLTPIKPLESNRIEQLRPATAVGPSHQSFEDVDSFELMPLLHDAEDAVRNQAIDELRRRGFTEHHLQLARLLTSPEAETRLKFVSLLPRLSGLDPRPWLMRLSRDPDPRVRRAALGVMGATRDPRLLQRSRDRPEHIH